MDWEQLTIYMDLVQAEAQVLAHDVRKRIVWDGNEFQNRADQISQALDRARKAAGNHRNL